MINVAPGGFSMCRLSECQVPRLNEYPMPGSMRNARTSAGTGIARGSSRSVGGAAQTTAGAPESWTKLWVTPKCRLSCVNWNEPCVARSARLLTVHGVGSWWRREFACRRAYPVPATVARMLRTMCPSWAQALTGGHSSWWSPLLAVQALGRAA